MLEIVRTWEIMKRIRAASHAVGPRPALLPPLPPSFENGYDPYNSALLFVPPGYSRVKWS